MYGIFTYIWLIFLEHVGKDTIHGSYGNEAPCICLFTCFFQRLMKGFQWPWNLVHFKTSRFPTTIYKQQLGVCFNHPHSL